MRAAAFIISILISFFTGMGVQNFLAHTKIAEEATRRYEADVNRKICAHRSAALGVTCIGGSK